MKNKKKMVVQSLQSEEQLCAKINKSAFLNIKVIILTAELLLPIA